jgi:hypothetical protein
VSFFDATQQGFSAGSPPPPPPMPPPRPPEAPQIPLPQAAPPGVGQSPPPLPQAAPAAGRVPVPLPQAAPPGAGQSVPLPQERPPQGIEKLMAARQQQMTELQNPHVRDWLIAYTKAEVGSQGKQAQTAFMESVLNRAAARGTSIQTQLAGRYYPAITHMRANEPITRADRDNYAPILAGLGTSNISHFSTGNASGSVGFNKGGPETSFGGERFAIEGPDMKWATAMGYAPTAVAGE